MPGYSPSSVIDAFHTLSIGTVKASEEEILQAEAILGFPIPRLLREFYLRVANGGIGPKSGVIIGLEKGYRYHDASVTDLYTLFRNMNNGSYFFEGEVRDVWPEKLLLISTWACGLYTCLDCGEENGPAYVYDPNSEDSEQPHVPALLWRHTDSFEEWLRLWLSTGDMWDGMMEKAKSDAQYIQDTFYADDRGRYPV